MRWQLHLQVRAAARRGMTLVELLVVVAIIGTLVAMLLPAVQMARESARRAQCHSNLRQLGIAMALHANAHGEYPIGCIGPTWAPPERHLSWNAQLLPFIEQRELWHAIDLQLASFHPTNKAVGKVIIDLFLCSSTPDPELRNPFGAWKGSAFTDYGGIYGVEGTGRDVVDINSVDENGQLVTDQFQTLRRDSLGVLIYELAVSPKRVTDGMTSTACIGETRLRRQTESEWINGQNIFAQEQSTSVNGIGLTNEIGSPHPGGASLVFCDAHVEFIAESIEQGVLNAMLTKAGHD